MVFQLNGLVIGWSFNLLVFQFDSFSTG